MKEDYKARKFTDLLKEHNVDDVLEGEVIDEIELSRISPNPYQPRKMFDEEKINELTSSIKEHGVFQPIILKKTNKGFIIVSGERRFRAAKNAGLKTIPAIIRPYEDLKIAEIALAENLQREDLNPIEEAEAYKTIMDRLDITQEQLAKKVGKSRSHVTNILGLVHMDENIKILVLENKISMGHARSLSKIKDAKIALKIAHKIILEQLSVRQVEELVKKEEKNRQITRTIKINEYYDLQEQLRKHLGVRVIIKNNKITIQADDKLEDVIRRILNQNVQNK
jgi:ParB family transcriptional regulator, chromosome partitioning protein